jgi:hypothetical protein
MQFFFVLFHQLNLAWSPGLIKPGLERAVESQDYPPPCAGVVIQINNITKQVSENQIYELTRFIILSAWQINFQIETVSKMIASFR